MFNEKILAILEDEGPAAFITEGEEGPHLVSTWNSYLFVVDGHTLAFPAGTYRKTESNLRANGRMQMLIGSRKVMGRKSPGTGFRLTGRGHLEAEGPVYDKIKARFPWARAAVIFEVAKAEQLL